MSRGVNKVIIVGNLGADPEVRYTGGGTCITSIRVATSEQWTDKQSGEKQECTEWHRIKLFGRLAEVAGEYLKKGKQVYIEGALRTDKYTDKDGIERYSTDIIATEMQMLGGAGGGSSHEGQDYGERRERTINRPQDRSTQLDQRGYGQTRGNNPQSAAPAPADAFEEDDIPF